MQQLEEIAGRLSPQMDVSIGKWFGKPCLKVGRKVFAALWGDDMAFKLTGEAHSEALQLDGAHLFDPRGKGHPMKEWVQIPSAHSSTWIRFAKLACDYVATAAQMKKDEIISGLVEVRAKVLDAATSLSPTARDEVFLGEWSLKEILAHLVGWDYTNLEAVKEVLAGRKPSFLEHHDRDWRSYNARLVEQYKREEFDELVASIKESHQKLVTFLQSVPAEEYVKRRRIVSLLGTETKDEREHCRQIEEFGKQWAA